MTSADEIIRTLGMRPLPGEGGFFVESYRSSLIIPKETLPNGYAGARCCGTAIYYLLTPESFSAMHLLPGDEVFHFYSGDPVEMLHLKPDGTGERVVIGLDLKNGMRPQVVVPAGVWQGSRLVAGGKYALLGTTMAPGFEFEDFTIGLRNELLAQYPSYSTLVTALTHH